MNYTEIKYDDSGGIALITLNRPQRLNAWTPVMGQELVSALTTAAMDNHIRVIIITGAGRGFCAGMDVEQLKKSDENTKRNRWTKLGDSVPRGSQREDYSGVFTYLPAIGKPIIAAINGPVAGSGLALVLACDIRFADDGVFFSSAFSRKGLVAEHGIAWLLTNLVGSAAALDILLSGRRVSAEESKEIGLVNFLSESGGVLDDAMEYAATMVDNCSPRSMLHIKRQVWNTAFETLHQATLTANKEMLKSFKQFDFAEAMAAQNEDRLPRFPGLDNEESY
jgi:enoyl-CoA hydratase/carnithine racemase